VERHLVARFRQIGEGGGCGHRARVVPDGHVAAVGGVPRARRILDVVGKVEPALHLVRREPAGGAHRLLQAQVEHVGLELRGGVQRPAAARPGLQLLDLDVVLVGEGVDDLAVVRPVAGEADDGERPLLLGRLDQPLHGAEALFERGGLDLDGMFGRRLLSGGRRAASGADEDGGYGGAGTYGHTSNTVRYFRSRRGGAAGTTLPATSVSSGISTRVPSRLRTHSTPPSHDSSVPTVSRNPPGTRLRVVTRAPTSDAEIVITRRAATSLPPSVSATK